MVKTELSKYMKLSIYWSVYVPTLIYSMAHVLIATERTRMQIQATEMSFIRRLADLSLRERVRSSVIREGLRVDPLVLHIEWRQLRCLGMTMGLLALSCL